jgi:acyl transferase domain-containing protein
MEIAVIGMAGRFPGARNVDEFWENLRQGRDVRRELPPASPPLRVPSGTRAVRTAYVLDDVEQFDALFFDMTPREAALTDPQHRILLECAYEALEDAGHVDERAGTIGVFASANFNTYLFQVAQEAEYADIAKHLEIVIGNDKDYLATRISYKLGLTGPSMSVQTACSSSLVAVCQAVQALRSAQCDLALVGGVGVRARQEVGYLVRPGDGVLAEDGQTRPFDARGTGFVEGSGAGVVVLRSLEDALANGDAIRAVIRGSATNNDGSSKVGFTAPSVTGQAYVVEEAIATAGVDPASIWYVEAHGTGTPLGDPIEVEALGRAYGAGASMRRRLGSVKANIGHLDAAAGIASLIKTVLCLEREYLPGTLGFEQPNPRARLAEHGFEVSARGERWPRQAGVARRAGVSSLGIGGTNAHVVLEEAPNVVRTDAAVRPELLIVSGRTARACEESARRLSRRLEVGSELALRDIAHTLRVGRRAFPHRRCVVASGTQDAGRALTDGARFLQSCRAERRLPASLAFLFPGAGRQYLGMGEGLYEAEQDYREVVDECADHARDLAGLDLRALLFEKTPEPSAWLDMRRTGEGFLALFATQVALARLWLGRGFTPACAIGHSVGEYAAAHLAGVFPLRRAIEILWERGRVFEQLPEGGMLALQLSEQEVSALLTGSLSLAAVNGPRACVVSGQRAEVDTLEQQMRARGVSLQRLAVAVPGHSALLAPHVEAFRACLAREPLCAPALPLVSSVSGAWISASELVDPAYWVRQLMSPVRFGAAVDTLLEGAARVVVQLGPGAGFLNQVRERLSDGQAAISSLPDADGPADGHAFALEAMGRAWLADIEVDFHCAGWTRHARRVSLPTYPFERERHWVERDSQHASNVVALGTEAVAGARAWVPSFRRRTPQCFDGERVRSLRWWVVAGDRFGWGDVLLSELRELGADAREVHVGGAPDRASAAEHGAPRESLHAWHALFSTTPPERWPDIVVHTGALGSVAAEDAFTAASDAMQGGLRAFAQGLAASKHARPLKLALLSEGLLRVLGSEPLAPHKATALGVLRTLPHELVSLDCLHIDVTADEPVTGAGARALLAEIALAEHRSHVPSLALRAGECWQACFEQANLAEDRLAEQLKAQSVYLITGGFGGIGSTLARAIAAARRGVHIALVTRPRPASSGVDTPERQELLRTLRELGAEVRVYQADVAELARMREVLADVQTWGELCGVVHAAGVIGGGLVELSGEAAEANLRPKILGLLVLDQLLRSEELDFLVLCSSLGAYTGGFGQADNTAANVFFDTFAQAKAGEARRLGRRVNVHAIGWDYWLDVGMLPQLAATHRAIGGRDFSVGLRASDGAAWLSRALSSDSPQLLVSVHDFPSVLEEARRERGAARTLFERTRQHEAADEDRRTLATPYLAPRDALETCLCEIWEHALGVRPIGVRDDFRELGGQSLTALPLVARIREVLRVQLALRDFFASGHVAGLAEHIRGSEGPSRVASTIAEALGAVRSMAPAGASGRMESEVVT